MQCGYSSGSPSGKSNPAEAQGRGGFLRRIQNLRASAPLRENHPPKTAKNRAYGSPSHGSGYRFLKNESKSPLPPLAPVEPPDPPDPFDPFDPFADGL